MNSETVTEWLGYTALLILVAFPLVFGSSKQKKGSKGVTESVSCGQPGCVRCLNDKGLLEDKTIQNAAVLQIQNLTATPKWSKLDLPFAYQKWLKKVGDHLQSLDLTNIDLPWQGSPNLVSSGSWDSFFIVNQGSFCSDVPSLSHLEHLITEGIQLGIVMGGTSFGNVFFSRLSGKFDIVPHCGATNARLRCQFPLLSPKNSLLIVAAQSHATPLNEWFVFDDSYEHTVKCDSEATRLTFIVDVWHPELTTHMQREIQTEYSP